MKKPILTLVLVMTISLIAVSAHAIPVGPGYGQDPGTEPPRAGVGNANQGNHRMYQETNSHRWSYGDEDGFLPPMAPVGPVGPKDGGDSIGPRAATIPVLVFDFSRIIGLVILR